MSKECQHDDDGDDAESTMKWRTVDESPVSALCPLTWKTPLARPVPWESGSGVMVPGDSMWLHR